MGRQWLAGQQHDRDVDALPVQLDQQLDAGNLRPVTMEDDDVGVARGIRFAGQRGDFPHAKPCLDSSSVRKPRAPSSMRRTRMASGSLTEARNEGAGASKATTS